MVVTLRFALNAETTVAFRKVIEQALQLGLRLERIPTQANAARPRPWYVAPVNDRELAERFLAAAKHSPVVDTAYLKPSDEAP
jgi:hypothetical protein